MESIGADYGQFRIPVRVNQVPPGAQIQQQDQKARVRLTESSEVFWPMESTRSHKYSEGEEETELRMGQNKTS